MSESLKKIPAEKLEALEETMAAFGQAAPPDWFDGSSVDEIAFSEYVLCKHPMRCIHDRLYDIDGLLSDVAVQSEILECSEKCREVPERSEACGVLSGAPDPGGPDPFQKRDLFHGRPPVYTGEGVLPEPVASAL